MLRSSVRCEIFDFGSIVSRLESSLKLRWSLSLWSGVAGRGSYNEMTEVRFPWLLIVLLCEGVWSVRFEVKNAGGVC